MLSWAETYYYKWWPIIYRAQDKSAQKNARRQLREPPIARKTKATDNLGTLISWFFILKFRVSFWPVLIKDSHFWSNQVQVSSVLAGSLGQLVGFCCCFLPIFCVFFHSVELHVSQWSFFLNVQTIRVAWNSMNFLMSSEGIFCSLKSQLTSVSYSSQINSFLVSLWFEYFVFRYCNNRIIMFSKEGTYITEWGERSKSVLGKCFQRRQKALSI